MRWEFSLPVSSIVMSNNKNNRQILGDPTKIENQKTLVLEVVESLSTLVEPHLIVWSCHEKDTKFFFMREKSYTNGEQNTKNFCF